MYDYSDICLLEMPMEGETEKPSNEKEEVEFSFEIEIFDNSESNKDVTLDGSLFNDFRFTDPAMETVTPPPELE